MVSGIEPEAAAYREVWYEIELNGAIRNGLTPLDGQAIRARARPYFKPWTSPASTAVIPTEVCTFWDRDLPAVLRGRAARAPKAQTATSKGQGGRPFRFG